MKEGATKVILVTAQMRPLIRESDGLYLETTGESEVIHIVHVPLVCYGDV